MKLNIDRKVPIENKEINRIDLVFPEKNQLDNGIPVYIISSGLQELVKIEFILNAGSRYQTFPLVAKFTAAMLTEGTENYSAEKIADIIDYYGAEIDQDCERDKVTITLTVLNKHLDKVLPVLYEILLKPAFRQNELSLLIQNKKQQFVLNNEKVAYLAKQKFRELLYGSNHPYGYNPKYDDFDIISREKLIAFHKDYYSSSNCWILVSGMPDKNLINQLNKYFGHTVGNKTKASPEYQVTKQSDKSDNLINLIYKENAVQSALRIGKVLFNYTHPDYYGFRVLNTILGGYFGSRLMSNLREDKGYTYGINAGLVSLKDSGYFFIGSQVGVEVCDKAIKEIYKEIKRLQQESVPDSELELVKNYMQGSFLRSMDGPFAQADMVKTLIEFNLNDDYYNKYIQKIKNITSEEIKIIAQKYLQKDDMYEIVAGKR